MEKQKFQVGDKVRRIKETHCGMVVGDVGTVTYVRPSGVITIEEYGGGDDVIHDGNYFELVNKKAVMTIQEQILESLDLKVGDIVKVTHSVPSFHLGWVATWNAKIMDRVVGKEGVVKSVSGAIGVGIDFDSEGINGFVFPAQTIEFVKRAPEYKKMKISKDYSAKVYADKIEVGCQTILITDFKKLQKLVNEMSKK